MHTIILILLALLLTGCNEIKTTTTTTTTQNDEATLDQLKNFEAAVWANSCWMEAIEGQSNRSEIITRYAEAQNRKIIEYLSTQSRGALLSKLDTLARGTSSHGYTKNQLEAALKIKEDKAEERARK